MGILSGRTVRHVRLDRSAARSDRRFDRRRSNSILLIWSGRSRTKSRSSKSVPSFIRRAGPLCGARGPGLVDCRRLLRVDAGVADRDGRGRPFTPGAQLQDLADLFATPAREAELVISMEATRLETGFGEMGWHWDHGVK
jgi:hypothetical protein